MSSKAVFALLVLGILAASAACSDDSSSSDAAGSARDGAGPTGAQPGVPLGDGGPSTSPSGDSSTPSPGQNDATSPTVPTNLVASAVSSTRIDLTWTASTDNVGVSGYRIYRDGVQIATTSAASYPSTGLAASTAYSHRVAAYDAAGNVSAQSSAASATTLVSSTGAGNAYFVSTSGNDGNSGTLSQPFRTVAHAAAVAAAGDTVYVRGGTYNESSINFANSGTSTQPITVTRYQSETPVIAGGAGTPVFDMEAQWIVLDHLTVTGGNPATIRLGYNRPASNITIQYSDISGWHGNDNNAGIYIESGSHPDNIVIQRNTIHDHQASEIGSAGVIIFQARGMTISNNDISNVGTGIHYKHSFDDPSVTLVENNYIHDNPGAGIMSNRRNGVIRNNVIRDNGAYSIKIFEEEAGCANLLSDSNTIVHNTIVHTATPIYLNREGGFGCDGAIETTLRDNLIYDWSSNEYQGLGVFVYNFAGMPYSPDGHTRADHNLLYSSINSTPIKVNGTSYAVGAAPLTVNTANISQAPMFVDYGQRAAALFNLALTAGSPGKNAASDGADMGAAITLVGPQ